MFKLTTTMIIDFAGCFLIEIVCKALFADLAPKAIVLKGRERREKRRALQALEASRVALAEAEAKKTQ